MALWGITSNDKGLVEIITKTDIAQYYIRQYAGKHTVGDVIPISYVSMNFDDSLSNVVSKMIEDKISRIFLKNKNNEPEGIMTFRVLLCCIKEGDSDVILDNSDQSISIIFTSNGSLSDSGFGNTISAKDVVTKCFESVD